MMLLLHAYEILISSDGERETTRGVVSGFNLSRQFEMSIPYSTGGFILIIFDIDVIE
jgi:hypothetical protein